MLRLRCDDKDQVGVAQFDCLLLETDRATLLVNGDRYINTEVCCGIGLSVTHQRYQSINQQVKRPQRLGAKHPTTVAHHRRPCHPSPPHQTHQTLNVIPPHPHSHPSINHTNTSKKLHQDHNVQILRPHPPLRPHQDRLRRLLPVRCFSPKRMRRRRNLGDGEDGS